MDATIPPREPGGPLIQFKRFTFRYPPPVAGAPPVTALEDVTLDVAAGEFLGVTGSTGSGKSTLCLAICGLVPQETGGIVGGRVTVAGLDTRYTPVPHLATHVGIVLQDPESNLVGLTVEDEVAFGPENLGIPPAEIARRVDWALEVTGLTSERHRPSTTLSGGQKQRLAIAAVLAMRPQILVLDEPTAQLDPIGTREVIAAIERLHRELGRRLTIVLVESDTDVLSRFAERVIVLHEGRVRLDGSPRAVFEHTEELAALGIRVPPLAALSAELARTVGTRAPFLTEDEAHATLAHLLECLGPLSTASAGTRGRACRADDASSGQASPAGDGNVGCRSDTQTGKWATLRPLVETEGVSHRYGEGRLALDGVSLSIGTGEFVALLGPNGSGKSTLAKHWNGLLRPVAGRVLVDGQDTRTTPIGQLARTVGYVFQNPDHQLFLPTVAEELAFGPHNLGLRAEALRERVEETLRRFGLTGVRDRHPTMLGRGLRQLVAVAAVYAMAPRLLVLDEPTGGLDGRTTARLMETLHELVDAGRSVLLITHDLSLAAEHAQRVVLMAAGRIVADGPARDILTDESLLARASMVPPTIARLSRSLARYGVPPAITVRELVDAVSARLTTGPRQAGRALDGGCP